MKRLFLVVVIIASVMLVAGATHHQDNEKLPVVTKAVAPLYPPIAASARVEGRVTVEALIDSAGNIVRIHAVGGHKLLQQAALDAADRWMFKSNGVGTGTHTVELTFNFRLVSDVENQETSFIPPYQIEIAYKPKKVIQTTTH